MYGDIGNGRAVGSVNVAFDGTLLRGIVEVPPREVLHFAFVVVANKFGFAVFFPLTRLFVEPPEGNGFGGLAGQTCRNREGDFGALAILEVQFVAHVVGQRNGNHTVTEQFGFVAANTYGLKVATRHGVGKVLVVGADEGYVGIDIARIVATRGLVLEAVGGQYDLRLSDGDVLVCRAAEIFKSAAAGLTLGDERNFPCACLISVARTCEGEVARLFERYDDAVALHPDLFEDEQAGGVGLDTHAARLDGNTADALAFRVLDNTGQWACCQSVGQGYGHVAVVLINRGGDVGAVVAAVGTSSEHSCCKAHETEEQKVFQRFFHDENCFKS